MPPVYSGQNTYHLWGPPKDPFVTAIVVGNGRERLESLFEEVTLFSTHHCERCMRWRDDMPLWIARKPLRDIVELWPDMKHFE